MVDFISKGKKKLTFSSLVNIIREKHNILKKIKLNALVKKIFYLFVSFL